jgi:hypothetical protein
VGDPTGDINNEIGFLLNVIWKCGNLERVKHDKTLGFVSCLSYLCTLERPERTKEVVNGTA